MKTIIDQKFDELDFMIRDPNKKKLSRFVLLKHCDVSKIKTLTKVREPKFSFFMHYFNGNGMIPKKLPSIVELQLNKESKKV